MILRLLRLALAVATLAPLPGFTQRDGLAAEVRIKAAFLYRFSGFVDWPPSAYGRNDSPFVIGVSGAEALADELEQVVAGRDVQGRAVTVRRVRRGDSLAGLHMLFIGQGDLARLAEILAAARQHPLLTVTEAEDALAHGSMINFVAVDNKLRFDVGLTHIERSNLRVSARLLAVARKVVAAPS